MKAIRKGTKASKFTVDAVLYSGLYYLPSTARYDEKGPAINACWYNRNRAKWLEDTFHPDAYTFDAILNFAKAKNLEL